MNQDKTKHTVLERGDRKSIKSGLGLRNSKDTWRKKSAIAGMSSLRKI